VKLPYRQGDSFALPLGNGATVDATIEECDHHTVDIAVAGLRLRVSDRALVLRRWKAHHPVIPRPATAALRAYARDDKAINSAWAGPAHAERIVATHCGVADLELPPLAVRAGEWKPAFGPDSRYVRITGRGVTLDPRDLAQQFPQLEVLDCSGIALTSLEFPPTLRALRLARVATAVDLRDLAALPLHTLALEQLRDVRGVESLAHWHSLEQLEMLGFWQLELDDVMPLVRLPRLVRAEIDVGGRRKNVELYRRTTWAYPWPFELVARLLV
jgi:hypothetical protein